MWLNWSFQNTLGGFFLPLSWIVLVSSSCHFYPSLQFTPPQLNALYGVASKMDIRSSVLNETDISSMSEALPEDPTSKGTHCGVTTLLSHSFAADCVIPDYSIQWIAETNSPFSFYVI